MDVFPSRRLRVVLVALDGLQPPWILWEERVEVYDKKLASIDFCACRLLISGFDMVGRFVRRFGLKTCLFDLMGILPVPQPISFYNHDAMMDRNDPLGQGLTQNEKPCDQPGS